MRCTGEWRENREDYIRDKRQEGYFLSFRVMKEIVAREREMSRKEVEGDFIVYPSTRRKGWMEAGSERSMKVRREMVKGGTE